MASPTGLARDAARAILAAEQGGFNARVGAILAGKGIAPFGVDFSAGSTSFFQGFINPDGAEINTSQIAPAPIAICLYAAGAVNAKTTNATYFSGLIELRIDVYVQMRARDITANGVEADDTDSIMDSVEEAILYAFRDGDWGEIGYNQDFICDRSPIFQFGDGYAQQSAIKISCDMRIN